MKKFALALAGLLFLAGIHAASAGSVPLFGGPAQPNPINNPADQADINALTQALNSAIGPGLSSGTTGLFTGGSIGGTFQSPGGLNSPANFLSTGLQCIRATNSGSCGTFSFFLTFVDSQGIQSFIPVYK